MRLDVHGGSLRAGVLISALSAQDGWTLLHHAAQTNSVAVARLLVKHGANVVAKTRGVRAQPCSTRGHDACERSVRRLTRRANVPRAPDA